MHVLIYLFIYLQSSLVLHLRSWAFIVTRAQINQPSSTKIIIHEIQNSLVAVGGGVVANYEMPYWGW